MIYMRVGLGTRLYVFKRLLAVVSDTVVVPS